MQIADLTNNKLWLAPLAGYTDFAFRSIAKLCGADVIVSEMVSADGLYYNESKSIIYAEFSEEQRPFGIQLFGSDPDMMKKGTEILMKLRPDFIDINMGCPVKKVVNRGAGSALMKDLDNACRITEAVKSVAQKHDILVTTKFRSGWDNNSINYLEYGKSLVNAGSDALILHARTRSQMFTGHSDWNHIKRLKQEVNIPVIGNGDVNSSQSALDMLNQTSCDGIMIGRGALGQPWLFKTIKDSQNIPFDLIDKKEIIKKHFNLALEVNDNKQRAIVEMRAHFNFYTKGLKGGSSLRNEINKTTDINLIFKIIERLEI